MIAMYFALLGCGVLAIAVMAHANKLYRQYLLVDREGLLNSKNFAEDAQRSAEVGKRQALLAGIVFGLTAAPANFFYALYSQSHSGFQLTGAVVLLIWALAVLLRPAPFSRVRTYLSAVVFFVLVLMGLSALSALFGVEPVT
jgi:hypothetical protein